MNDRTTYVAVTYSELRLWEAVLRQAILDLESHEPANIFSAIAWFKSRNHEPCSFEWVCEYLDLDPNLFRRKLEIRIRKSEKIAWDLLFAQQRKEKTKRKRELVGGLKTRSLDQRDATAAVNAWLRGM